MDSAADTIADYPSKTCAKAEKALYAAIIPHLSRPLNIPFCSLDSLNKTRELSSLLPAEWLPNVYACVLFPLPPEQGLPSNAITYFEAVASEYIRAPAFVSYYCFCKYLIHVLQHFHLGWSSTPAGTFTRVLRAPAPRI